MLDISRIAHALIMLLAANGAPIIAGKLCGKRFSGRIDFGRQRPDGRALFGSSKTWRGLFAAMLLTSGMTYLLGLDPVLGLYFGAAAMAGDVLASFCKRRMGLPESSRARGFDTVPESMFPLLLYKAELGLGWLDIILTVICFFLIEEYVSPILYQLHIRKKPY